jgi:hypothetical protein
MATRVFGADQCNRRTPLGLAFPRSEPCLSSSICWLIQLEIGATRARSGDDVGTHGGSERAGRWAGLGVIGTGDSGRCRARKNSEGPAGLLQAGHVGTGQAAGDTSVRSCLKIGEVLKLLREPALPLD